ncbi:MAG: peptidoglycan-binding domain-containing protein, partial [Alphaproteobacteria bacterium]
MKNGGFVRARARELRLRLPLQRGDDVRAVQQALIRAGMLAGGADGIFGPATHRAVLDFQRRIQARQSGPVASPPSGVAPPATGCGAASGKSPRQRCRPTKPPAATP